MGRVSNGLQYLSLSLFCSQRLNPLLKNLIDFVWHFVSSPVHCLGNGVREETIASKDSLHSWLESFAIHAKLMAKRKNYIFIISYIIRFI